MNLSNKHFKMPHTIMLAFLLLNNNLVSALQGDQVINILDQANYQQITDTSPIDLSTATLRINSSYGVNNEPTTIFANVFSGVGLAVKPANIIAVGNITAIWSAIVSRNALDLQYLPGSFANLPTTSHFKDVGGAIDVLATDSRYLSLVSNLRSSSSIAEYQSKLKNLMPTPSINTEVAHIQELVLDKVEQRLVELDTAPVSYNAAAGSFFGKHLWFKPFVTIGKQDNSPSKNVPQYKSLIIGGSLGFDEINLNNTKAAGVSLSIAKMKLYRYLAADKNDAYSFNALLYGKYVNRSLWFMQWISGLGVSYANQNREINLSNIHEIAQSHHKWYVSSFQFSVGRQWQNDQILIKPGIGLLSTYIHNEAYKEKNADLTGLAVLPRDHYNVYAFGSIDLNNKLSNDLASFAINTYGRVQYLLTSPKQSYFAKFINVDVSEFKSYSIMHRIHYKLGMNVQYLLDESYDGSIGADYDFHKSFRSFTAYVKLGLVF